MLSAEQLNKMFGLTEKNETHEIMSFTIDGNTIDCYASYSYFDAKSYVKSPVRSASGVIENLNSYATFLTPRLRIKFSMMPLETYRTIMKLIQSKNEFVVECYDVVWDTTKKWKAYFSTEDYPELFIYDLHTLGAIGYEIELQGTNADLDYVSVVYHSNPPENQGNDFVPEGGDEAVLNQEIIIGENAGGIQDLNFGGGWKFKSWNTMPDGTGDNYDDRSVIKIQGTLVLYAQWQTSQTMILSFDYGLSAVAKEDNNGILTEIKQKEVQFGKKIGTLPKGEGAPPVTSNGVTYHPYGSGAWYRNRDKTGRVSDNDLYWINANSTIYYLYNVFTYRLYFVTGQPDIKINPKDYEYRAEVYLPILVKSGMRFLGWYRDQEFTKLIYGKFTMPPKQTHIYAKWEVEE